MEDGGVRELEQSSAERIAKSRSPIAKRTASDDSREQIDDRGGGRVSENLGYDHKVDAGWRHLQGAGWEWEFTWACARIARCSPGSNIRGFQPSSKRDSRERIADRRGEGFSGFGGSRRGMKCAG